METETATVMSKRATGLSARNAVVWCNYVRSTVVNETSIRVVYGAQYQRRGDPRVTVRRIQWALASIFFVLGGWALIAPRSVIELTLLPQYRTGATILPFMVGCFGAQAIISGIFAAFSVFTRRTFLVYGIALLPFFGFNYWFTIVDPVFTKLGLADAAGNAIMLALCVLGWKRTAVS